MDIFIESQMTFAIECDRLLPLDGIRSYLTISTWYLIHFIFFVIWYNINLFISDSVLLFLELPKIRISQNQIFSLG